MELLEKLLNIHAPSGEEYRMTEFLINLFETNKDKFKNKFELFYGNEFQDSLVVKIGEPKIAVFAHMDSTGFTIKYDNEVIPIGSPEMENNIKLKAIVDDKIIDCKLVYNNSFYIDYKTTLESGTTLTYKIDFKNTKNHIQSAYLDNRLGVRNAIDLAFNIENGLIVFSCYEEHGGGSVEKLSNIIYNRFNINKALIYDITWQSEGIKTGKGVVISLRDKMIPRKKFLNRIVEIAKRNNINYQLEVESSGSSDGGYIQKSPYPIDWCFIGIACKNIHSTNEKVNKADIIETDKLYRILMKEL